MATTSMVAVTLQDLDSFQAEFRASAAEGILMPTEPPGGLRTIASGFAEYSLEERFLKRGKFPLI